jgi:hypothetical protein
LPQTFHTTAPARSRRRAIARHSRTPAVSITTRSAFEPDWENPVCRRIVHIEDEAGRLIAEGVPLDGYVLHHESEDRARLCAKVPMLIAALERIASIPLWSEAVPDQALRDEFISSGEYDVARDEFEPSADTESAYLREAVEAARGALTSRAKPDPAGS